MLVLYRNTKLRHNPQDGGNIVLCNVCVLPQTYTVSHPTRWRQYGPLKRLVSYHNTARCHKPEDLDLNLHRRENLKSWVDDIVQEITTYWKGYDEW
jgi:hypothetical protein